MRKQHFKLLMLMGMLLLAACSTATPAAPTPAPTADLNLLRTEVAATVLAQCAQICALTPTATQIPTNTPSPTPTQDITATQVLTLTTGTPGTPGASTGDQAKWISQTISDGTRFAPGETFTMVWRIQNIGTTTWTSAYRLRHFSGERFGAPEMIALGTEVAPNQTVDITVQMTAPNTAGTYRTDWVMSNATLYNFNQPVYLEITVALPATSTPTQTVAPSATPTVTNTPEPSATPTATATPN